MSYSALVRRDDINQTDVFIMCLKLADLGTNGIGSVTISKFGNCRWITSLSIYAV